LPSRLVEIHTQFAPRAGWVLSCQLAQRESIQGVTKAMEPSEMEANMQESCLVRELRAVAEIAARAAVAAENGGWEEAGLCAEDVRKRTSAVSRRVLLTAQEASGKGEPRQSLE
jgi:hypothetical protein